MTKESHKEQVNFLLSGCGVLLAFIAIIIALLVWIKPFEANTPSPLDKPKLPEDRIKCRGGEILYQGFQWKIQGDTRCSIELFEGESIIGSSLYLNDTKREGACFIFGFTGPINIDQLQLYDTNFTFYTNLSEGNVISSLLEGSEKDLRNRTQSCDSRGILQYRLPLLLSIPVSREEGLEYQALLPGEYAISIVDGAYSSAPEGYDQVLWRTRINIYINRPIEWGKRLRQEPSDDSNLQYLEPINPDRFLGSEETYSLENATKAGKASPPTILELKRSDVILFVAIDDKGWYTNPQPNQGYLVVKITLFSH